MTYKITISKDECAENPRTDRDGLPPLFTNGGRRSGVTEYGFDLNDILLSKEKAILRKKKELLALIDYSMKDIKDEMNAYGYSLLSYLTSKIIDFCDNDIDSITNIFDIIGIKYYSRTSRGYSQGDRLDCLLVATDKWIEEVGVKKKDIKLESNAKLFNTRVRGDTYCYNVIKMIPLYREGSEEIDSYAEESVDSYGGFYDVDRKETIDAMLNTMSIEYGITKEMIEDAFDNIEY